MSKLFPLKGCVQPYAWGGSSFIADLIGYKGNEKTIAEYWLGAHANAPATISTPQGEKKLDAFLLENPLLHLGSYVQNNYKRLPYLFKVLDVKDMLSIQVHPTKKQAEVGFEEENKKGIAPDAATRNFKDDNHKPEIMVALSEFWLLHGFLPEVALLQVLKDNPEFSELISIFKSQGYKGLYQTVMEQPQEKCNKQLRPLIDRILPLYEAGKLDKSSPDFWAARAASSPKDSQTIDKGIYSIYFFNIIKANEGEAVFQDAGLPHAYLEGQNIELMANSDNVLRGGLTPKHIDIKALMEHVKFEATIPNIFSGDESNNGMEKIYRTPVKDFELSKIELPALQSYETQCETIEIILCIKGKVMLTEGGKQLTLEKGASALLTSGAHYKITSESAPQLFKASVPE
ncbi:mannose-6-phosphate isomerase, class I [Reichenbachiella sp. MALMAid0571]|uniref:mannose-6-phosphate isomerase, class I n=1 Tax=Reichenbachiella sp. MALMAid0571 TaxID=3143939 RepID=UPI0032DEB2A2